MFFSLNVPLAPAVDRLAADLQSKLSGFDRVRDRHTLVCKRFGVDDVPDRVASDDRAGAVLRPAARHPQARRTRRPTRGPPPAARGPTRPPVAVIGIDIFDAPASGSAPVLYLVIESDALVRVHRRLCAAYGAIAGIEGDDFVPHITVARGGNPRAGRRRPVGAAFEFEPIRWRVHALDLYDPEFREVAATIDL